MTAASNRYYVSADGDRLDQIVAGHYGNVEGGKVEAVLKANPGLAALGAVLGGGVRIALPEIETASPVETAALWG